MGVYQSSKYYDKAYRDNPKYNCPYFESPYFELWKECIRRIDFDKNILEVGCGTGQFRKMLWAYGFPGAYVGFDFSSEAIKICDASECYVGDATSLSSYPVSPKTQQIVCMEVLEHLSDDVAVIRLWDKGVDCVLTVPCFDDPAHVRWFNSADEIRERYENLYYCLKIEDIIVFDRWYIIKAKTI